MNFFNQLYLTVFNHFKARYKQKANTIALFYVSILQIALLLLGGIFFTKFLEQMKVVVMSSTNSVVLFCMIALFIHFKNWMNYSGRKRRVLNAKQVEHSLIWRVLSALIEEVAASSLMRCDSTPQVMTFVLSTGE